jgi:hypothetical protein
MLMRGLVPRADDVEVLGYHLVIGLWIAKRHQALDDPHQVQRKVFNRLAVPERYRLVLNTKVLRRRLPSAIVADMEGLDGFLGVLRRLLRRERRDHLHWNRATDGFQRSAVIAELAIAMLDDVQRWRA